MAVVKFYKDIKDEQLSFAVIATRMGGKWVLCRHKDRTTLEFPGGHREAGESILGTAKRELREETGAKKFTIKHSCYYSEQNSEQNEVKYGALFYAEIFNKDKKLHSEIERILLFDELPTNWTYPDIMTKLMMKLKVKDYDY